MTSKYYAGIGSRQTPAPILALMTRAAAALGALGWTLRSGGANGADTAFAQGADTSEIYLPWAGFNGVRDGIVCGDNEICRLIAEKHHPNWAACSHGARALHTRNVAQVLGLPGADESRFVLCWTIGGTGAGGTGQAIRIARAHNIEIFDLGLPAVERRIRLFLGE